MKNIKKTYNVESFSKKHNVLVKKGGAIETFNNEIISLAADSHKVIGHHNNALVVLNSKNQSFLANSSSYSPFMKEYRINAHSDLFLGLYQRGNSSYSIYSLKKDEIIFTSNNWEGHSIIDKLVFSNTQQHISCLDISDNKVLGTCKLPNNENDKVYEFSGIYENKLICTTHQQDILILDYIKGQIIKHFKKPGVSFYLNAKNSESKIFIGLMGVTFIEIDMISNNVSRKINIESQLATITKSNINSVFVRTSIVKNDLVFFIANRDIVGIFNPESATIIDYIMLPFEKKTTSLKLGRDNLQVTKDFIFVLDSENTLHQIGFNEDLTI